uniref:dipeptidyl peptidase 3 n=1 Tax=Myxine glutinosa TaxID=7769 RepID=UPI00358F8C65
MPSFDKSQFILPNHVGIVPLENRASFEQLSLREKLYAHYLSLASWYGGLVVLLQTSPESPAIYVLLQRIFRTQPPDELRTIATSTAGLSDTDYTSFLVYAAGVYSNMGNYKSFGDSKFVPNLPKEKLKKLVWSSKAFQNNQEEMTTIWEACEDRIFSLEDHERQLGLGSEGISTYFSGNCTAEDSKLAQRFLDEKEISAYNTRLFKVVAPDHSVQYEVRLASVVTQDGAVEGEEDNKCGSHQFEGKSFTVKRGDYSLLLSRVVTNLKKAKEHTANDVQVKMLEQYIRSFTLGSIAAHKDGSRFWIKDKSPIVESYIGFIESYRDPSGTRGEFEGFVAMVHKEMSQKFTNLVGISKKLISELPWPTYLEKDTFLRPDFTSLDILTYAGSGLPAGINIPNYDDIRQSEGFKNVALGNVVSASYIEERDKLTFLAEEDKDLYVKFKGPSFDVQVGLHELLGHGSGKLLSEDENRKLNFDKDAALNPETGKKVTSWYKAGETYDGKFGSVASTYEECRAESVGLYLCLNTKVLRIFGHEGQQAQDVCFINWLHMARAGVQALEYYTPETTTWRQAHMQARFVILRVLLEAGQGLVMLQHIDGSDGRPDAVVTVDKSKISTIGKEAIGAFLLKLQWYKSTADVEQGTRFYERYCTVTDDTPERFLTLQKTVLMRKVPRKLIVLPNTTIGDGDVKLVEYKGSASGMVQSFTERFSDGEEVERDLLTLSQRDQHHWASKDSKAQTKCP